MANKKKAAPRAKAKAKAAPAAPSATAIKEAMTKSVMLSELADRTGLTKKAVTSVMGELA